MPGISIHVVDVARGIVATGMLVTVFAEAPDGSMATTIASGTIGENGLLNDPALAVRFAAGVYRAQFYVGNYYAASGAGVTTVPFLDVVRFDFGIADPDQHYHLPFKCTAWGYSCFRGGA